MAELTWLQCQIPKMDWEAVNQRRLKQGLKWSELLLPAAVAYLDKLEACQPPRQAEQQEAKAKKAKQKEVNK